MRNAILSFPRKIRECCFAIWARDGSKNLPSEAGAAIQESHNSRGCAFGDFDNDGDLDVLIVNLNEPPSLLRNDVTGNNSWLKVKLIGTKSNRSAIGARVVVKTEDSTQTQEVQSQSSFLSCNDFRACISDWALAKSAEVKIRWPNGDWQTLPAVGVNQLVTVKEGVGIVPSAGWASRTVQAHVGPDALVRAGERRLGREIFVSVQTQTVARVLRPGWAGGTPAPT